MISNKLKDNNFVLLFSVIAILAFRLVLNFAIPLLDKTEARYAEISRLMYETKEWIVVQIDYGFPFWAKPPLSTWLSAGSFEIFGVNEFAARFPSYLLSVLLLVIAGKWAKKEGHSFYLPGFLLLTMPEFLIHTGVVSTDSALTFCITIMMLSFWKVMNNPQKTIWNYLFFVALGFGMLAKGPLIMVLSFPPLFVWCLLDFKRFKDVFSRFPMLLGILIIAAIALPWYYLVEQRSPGFSNYFFVGEHYKRFLVPGWNGDLYGNPKYVPTGIVWAYLIAFTFPWFPIVIYQLWKNKSTIFKDRWVSFLVLWLLWLPFFFTFSKNILHTYILPVTFPLMLLMVHYWNEFDSKKTLIRLALFFPTALFVIGSIALVLPTNLYKKLFGIPNISYVMNSDKYLLDNLKVNSENKQIPLYYYVQVDNDSIVNKQKNYSGEFYSNGKEQVLINQKELDSVLSLNKKFFFVIPTKKQNDISKESREKMKLIDHNYKTSVFEIN
jgi:4-amino-4-deoxy-L-arabinose transferase-like glycosyltransferase